MTGLTALGTSPALAKLKTVERTGKPESPISATVSVPAGYETVYVSGNASGKDMKDPNAPDPGDTEAQATKTLEKIKATLAEQGMTLGDVVMMHAWLAADPKLGTRDSAGWGRAFKKFFGTPEQPNKPSRTSVQVALGSPSTLIEIEVIAVRKPK